MIRTVFRITQYQISQVYCKQSVIIHKLTHLEGWFIVTIRSVDEVSFEEDARSVLGG
jgi:hypothetical protein